MKENTSHDVQQTTERSDFILQNDTHVASSESNSLISVCQYSPLKQTHVQVELPERSQ